MTMKLVMDGAPGRFGLFGRTGNGKSRDHPPFRKKRERMGHPDIAILFFGCCGGLGFQDGVEHGFFDGGFALAGGCVDEGVGGSGL